LKEAFSMPETVAKGPVLDATASAILDAASKRFLHYGYGKTTMSEIAADCNMSTGNLYRFFPGKLDIAEAFVARLRAEQVKTLRAAAAGEGRSAAQRLRRFFQTKLRLVYDRFHDNPRAFELSAEILRERPQFAAEWEQAERAIIVEILEQGASEGQFGCCDFPHTARILQDAAYRFSSPTVFLAGEHAELSRELNDVLDLIIDGFSWRQRGAAEAAR
jgi:AcrR family transcriptional regulator